VNVFVADVLPPFSLSQPTHNFPFPDPKKVRCHLVYKEESTCDGLAHAVSTDGAHNHAVVQISLFIKDASGATVDLLLAIPGADDAEGAAGRGLMYGKLWSYLIDPRKLTFHFQITIFVSTEHASSPDVRREHVARELTTGYRNYVSILLLMLSCNAAASQWNIGRSLPAFLRADEVLLAAHAIDPLPRARAMPNTNLHSNREDAWRLICPLSSVEKIAKIVNGSMFGRQDQAFVLGLQNFVDGLTVVQLADGSSHGALRIIEKLHAERKVMPQIALRKSLEYYIYEAMNNIPSS
jgi:hypothetical protein